MVDYDKKGLGNANSVMRIRDTGSKVSLMIYVPWGDTYWGSVGYSWSGVGGSGNSTFGYTGGSWKTVKTLTVTNSGNLTWTINNTGTSGFGGPHTQTAYIERTSKPSVPDKPTFSSITHTSAAIKFTANSNGGAAIDSRQIQYGTGSTLGSKSNKTITSDGNTTVHDLKPGTTVYAWGRVHNSKGWSGWSPKGSFKTLAGALVRVNGKYKSAVPYVRINGVWKVAVPYRNKSGTWVETIS